MWLVLTASAFAQVYEASPCVAVPALATELAAGTVTQITPRGPTMRMAIASSVLAATPSLVLDPVAVRAAAKGSLFGDDEEFATVMADARTCVYGAPNVIDGDPATAWCEGAAGVGVGEVVMVEIPAGELEIRTGYTRSPERYRQNARPRRVEVVLLGPGYEPMVQGTMHAAMPVLGRSELEFADLDAWQPLPLPAWSVTPLAELPGPPGSYPVNQRPRFLAIRILTAWPGEKWEDTCISEVRAKVSRPITQERQAAP